MTKTKKVLLVMVEGVCEEELLYNQIRKTFNQYDLRIEIQQGDILFSPKQGRKKIKGLIGDKVRQFMRKNKFRKSDLLGILHVIDMDGSFIQNDHVKINPAQIETIYYDDNYIWVQNEGQRKYIIHRNSERRRNIGAMNTIGHIMNGAIPYQIYYFSRHLEHVLFNDPNPDKGTKVEKIEQFMDCLKVPIEDWLRKHMYCINEGSYSEKYNSSWEIISNGSESLQRQTNVPLLFDYVRYLGRIRNS